ncbi:unnamed protein product [Cyprideis torosa]|uniref:Uncharacterized protein n=1 Tax=Cyprideis torosa TaxID=163714 RepID=A0A7R8ZWV9_9CRUS|nr:unnamed protein product [Cyprideis torosa]CAG0906069.1 unnamed protein product [Cyprideis torosa]
MGTTFVLTNKAKKHNEHVKEEKVAFSLLGYGDEPPEGVAIATVYRYVVTQAGQQFIGYLMPKAERDGQGYVFVQIDLDGQMAAQYPIDMSEEKISSPADRDLALVSALGPGKTLRFAEDFKVVTDHGKRSAYLISGKFPGFKTHIAVMMALTTDYSLVGFEVLEHEEDPGLGGEIERPYFKNQFRGKSYEVLRGLEVVKEPLPDEYYKALEMKLPEEVADEVMAQYRDHNIYALTGATISSVAVNDGIKAMVKKFAYRVGVLDEVLSRQQISVSLIPTYTLTIATWVTVIDLSLAALLPEAYAKMGIFVKIIVAFAIITMRLEMFACKEPSAELIREKSFGADNEIRIEFSGPVDKQVATDIENYTVYEENDPDIRLPLEKVVLSSDTMQASLLFADPLNTTNTHIVTIRGLGGKATETFSVAKSYFGYLFSVLIAALLIKNFVFTKYLGLCVFFGTSKRKSTAKGMGVVFTLVMLATGIMGWFFYQYVLKPYNLTFLQIVVFIGLTSLTVQAVDTILRKVNPVLFNSFGVYLVLVIANCVVIAVPLVMASNEYNLMETIMLSLGAGGGFLLALYLMSSVATSPIWTELQIL